MKKKVIKTIKSYQRFTWFNILVKPFLFAKFTYELLRSCLNGEFKQLIAKNIPKISTPKNHTRILLDILLTNFLIGADISNYFNYDFYQKNLDTRKSFITAGQCHRLWYSFNDYEYHDILKDKFLTYQKLKEHFGRKIIQIIDSNDLSNFKSFISAHKTIFIKPPNQSCGIGTERIVIDENTDLMQLFHKCRKHRLLVEEEIVQHPDLAKFHPLSVNTIRVNTIRTRNGVNVIHAFLRMGNLGSTIDNFSSGGISALINPETGEISTDGVGKDGLTFTHHPYTNVKIKGSQIPSWDKIKSTAGELAEVIPQLRLIGWDFSVSMDGMPILVEGNPFPGFVSIQITDQLGKRRIYEEALINI